MSKIAFLGTGLLGSGFVKGLRSKGHEVTAWNRTAGKAQELAELGASVARTPAEAVAGADRVHLCLSADAAVDSVLEAILPAVARTTPILDHSTTAPQLTLARGARLAAAGQAFLHAPVFMSPAAAVKCAGIMMCSGPRALFEQVQSEVATMTGELWFVGEDYQRAAGLKLLGNSMLFSIAGGLADVFTIAAGCGLSPDDAMEVLGKLKPAGALEVRGKKMAAGDYSASFELTMARKDMGLMLDAVGDRPLVALRAMAQRSDQLIAEGHGADDLGVLAIGAVPPRKG
jgi:3-hydroxyisobutyrate dehydrogenase-like beta-hydroxyacid dehydrogenase